ncbi:MAG: hypothetical protein RLZZ196_310 [Bacteroidota bacterium]|jgi:hypothetical protein
MQSRYDLTDTRIEIYYNSSNEFEKVRSICLQEDNWLRHNYTPDNLIIEQHSGYGVVYQISTGKPMVMGGVFNDSRYPKNVAKQINRLYTFPEFRMKHTDMTDGFRVTCSLIDALEKVNNYEIYLITMQNRNRGGKRWWDTWRHHMDIASNGKWKYRQGYLQTCPWNVQKCWQNFVYYETAEGAFDKWNPTIITDEAWHKMPEGD